MKNINEINRWKTLSGILTESKTYSFDFKNILENNLIYSSGLEKNLNLKIDLSYDVKDVVIEWYINLDFNTDGIENVNFFLKNISGNIYWEADKVFYSKEELQYLIDLLHGQENDNVVFGKIPIASDKLFNNKNWKVNMNLELKDNSIKPSYVDIDFTHSTIEIT